MISDPIAAVTASDPYPYYAELVRERPFHFDETLQTWVATSAAAVEAALTDPALRVRPPAEALAGMVRFTDGSFHDNFKDALLAAFASLDWERVRQISEACAHALADGITRSEDWYTAFAFHMPALVTAHLLGLPASDSTFDATTAIVREFSPGALSQLQALLANADRDAPLLSSVRNAAGIRGIDDASVVTNAIGLLFQGYDATAALIGNTLLAAATQNAGAIDAAFVAEVARHDSPVANTRRYGPDRTILVVLAAANRDPAVNAEPHRFDRARAAPRSYAFGVGGHACPAARMAITIATAAVDELLRTGLDCNELVVTGYRPSINVRNPILRERKLVVGIQDIENLR